MSSLSIDFNIGLVYTIHSFQDVVNFPLYPNFVGRESIGVRSQKLLH